MTRPDYTLRADLAELLRDEDWGYDDPAVARAVLQYLRTPVTYAGWVGSGCFANVYRISDDRVVKVTSDTRDALVCERLKGLQLSWAAQVFNVWLDAAGRGVHIIEMEYCPHKIHRNVYRPGTVGYSRPDVPSESTEWVVAAHEWLTRNRITCRDVYADNIRKTTDGRTVIVDFGCSILHDEEQHQ